MPLQTLPSSGSGRLSRSLCLHGFGVVALWTLAATQGQAADVAKTGEQIYKRMCLDCHGATGEGSEDYPRVLAGDRSVAQLSKLIARTMPDDDPGTCVGDDAEKVAAYIYEAFYSKQAQERSKPPKIELSRLTVRQYQNTLADLIGSFRGPAIATWGETRGLRGEYFKSRRYRDSDRVIDRVDPEVQFDFGEESPDPSTIDDPSQYSIRWQGSLRAPETGEYEFNVKTDQAMRFWVNDLDRPLIDATVKSGSDLDHRETIRLLGGRVYPLRIEFSKAKQGVDDSKKGKKPKPVKASIALEWTPPHRSAEVIPSVVLSPVASIESYVVTTPFPPDDRSVGYERGTTISKAWDQATTDAAIEAAGYVGSHLRTLADVSESAGDREVRLRAFCRKFAERAFRRPLNDEATAFFIERQFKEAGDLNTAVKRVVMLALISPRFLYREVGADPFAVASRLSYGLWDSLPDPALLDAAASGKLTTREQVTAQAERMVTDLRTRAKVREFFQQWLRVENAPEIAKDPQLFADFDASVASDLRTSLDLFLDDVVWGDRPDFRRLLLDEGVYLNGRLSKLYGGGLPADSAYQKVTLEPGERAGLLSHPYLLATFAYTATSSPIHRGVFLSRSVLGRALRPPPMAIAPLAAELHADLTTRERVTIQTRDQACVACHGMINPLGFGLEHFDAVGRFRHEEKGKPIDSTGSYDSRTGASLKFTGARDLAQLLADSDEAHSAFIEQLFHYLIKQPVRAFGPRTLADLRRSFVANEFHIRKLIVEIVATSALPPAPESRTAQRSEPPRQEDQESNPSADDADDR